MPLTPEDLQSIRLIVVDVVASMLIPKTAEPTLMLKRLNVEEFAVCIERCEEHVRRMIRAKKFKGLVDGPPYLIHPKALAVCGVTPEIATARLAQWRIEQEQIQPQDGVLSPA